MAHSIEKYSSETRGIRIDIGRALGYGFCILSGRKGSKKLAFWDCKDPPPEAFEIRKRNQYIQISSCLPKETEIGSWTNKTLTFGINKNWKKISPCSMESKRKEK